MQEDFYFDTSIWIDFYEKRNNNGELALLFESNNQDSKSILRFKLTSSDYGFSALHRAYGENAWVEVACNEPLNKVLTEASIVHEKAHDLYDQMTGSNQLDLLEQFKTFINQNVANGNFGKKRFLGRFAGESSWTYDEGCVISVFMERYYKGESPDAGHPWDNLSEVFASTTAIMRCHADELFSQIEKLPTKQDKTLAMETMSKIVGLYQKYCRTGTALFPRKILAYMI